MKSSVIKFKGIDFYNYPISHILKKISKGGYLTAPAASSLSSIHRNKEYYKALKNATITIFDSGFFCILIRLILRKKVRKCSGYMLCKKFLNQVSIKNKRFLLIDPNKKEALQNYHLLKKKNFSSFFSYVAPQYTKSLIAHDIKLFELIDRIKPHYILINIGGEVQEILAYNINKNLKYKKISILCLGAAIAFLTGSQARITDKIDKFYLGWFYRLLFAPRVYYKRIICSFFLIKLFIKN